MQQLPAIPGDEGRAPMVSVIVAAFNARAFIAEACRSALAQTHTPLEVIVVDDGSTDDTAAVVAALADTDTRLRLIRQPNQGVAAARNRAIAAANGEFLAPMDADDIWDPTKIARQVTRMLEAGPDTGLVYCWWAWVDRDGVVLDRSPRWRSEGHMLEQLVEINVTGNASVPLLRRSVVARLGGYRPELRPQGCQGCEDWDLVLRVAEHHPLAMVPAVLVGYRRRSDSMSSEGPTMWRSREAVMAALAARQPSLSPEIFKRSRAQFALHIAGIAFWSRHYLEACLWGLRTGSPTLLLAVLPYVIRMLLRRGWPGVSIPQHRTLDPSAFERSCPAEPQIPYDRIYARRWRRYQRG